MTRFAVIGGDKTIECTDVLLTDEQVLIMYFEEMPHMIDKDNFSIRILRIVEMTEENIIFVKEGKIVSSTLDSQPEKE